MAARLGKSEAMSRGVDLGIDLPNILLCLSHECLTGRRHATLVSRAYIVGSLLLSTFGRKFSRWIGCSGVAPLRPTQVINYQEFSLVKATFACSCFDSVLINGC